MPIIGILGGIGSGKSSVVRNVKGLNLFIIDADRIGHDLLADHEIQKSLRQVFGDEIFSEPDVVDRTQIDRRVFGETTTHQSALKQLNDILHPAIRREIYTQIESAQQYDAIILDAALLLEGGWDEHCDSLIFIDTPDSSRRQRVAENRNWTAEELAKREATQLSLEVKKSQADFTVDNSGRIQDASDELKRILETILNVNNCN